ncbi:MAG TPA: ABC transporter ATP-binding protein, partial [Armatimonadota bacterium]
MHTIKRLLAFAVKYWQWIALNVLCMSVVTVVNVMWPQFKRLIIDKCFTAHHYDLLPYYAMAIIAAVIINGVVWFCSLYLTEFIAQKTVYDIRNRLFDHIQRLSFSYHDEAETGQLISRATSDVDVIRQFLGEGLLHLVMDSMLLIGVIAVCFYMNWRLAALALMTLPFLVFSVYKFRSIVGPLFTAVQDQIGDMTTAIQQNLVGIRVVKAFAREDFEVEKFSKQARDLYEKAVAASRVQAKYQPLMDLLASSGLVLVLWYGGAQVIGHKHGMTLGMLVAFYEYIAMIVWPVRILGWVVMIAQWAIASGDRIFEILDTHPEVHLKDGNRELKNCRGAVEFRDVAFSYQDGGHVLKDVNLTVEPGEMVALVGATGSGKSTIINLLPRFYDVTAGSLMIDGVDIREYRVASLRRNIGIVSQETFL